MPEFFNVLPPEEARQLLLKHLITMNGSEVLPSLQALGRVTTRVVRAPHALPLFRRSTMDGYAVRAGDTFGASPSLPAFLTVVGEVQMGRKADVALKSGQVSIVHTGGMIPDSADAVVPIEHSQKLDASEGVIPPYEIEILTAVAVGQNVLQIGEDVGRDDVVLPAGHYIRPQDVGGLLAVGVTTVEVARRPRVAILATGDELVVPELLPGPGQIRDINSYTIACQTVRAGGIPDLVGIIPDMFEAFLEAAVLALSNNDMVVMTAGSSVSIRDMTVRVVDQMGEPGVLLHGVATRPGKPTIVGAVEGKPVLGLPGNPVSAMVQFAMFGLPAIYSLQGLQTPPRQGMVWARTDQNIASESGREDFIPAKLIEAEEGFVATPVFGKSNLIYTLVNADGLIRVPLNKSGIAGGEWVEVQLF